MLLRMDHCHVLVEAYTRYWSYWCFIHRRNYISTIHSRRWRAMHLTAEFNYLSLFPSFLQFTEAPFLFINPRINDFDGSLHHWAFRWHFPYLQMNLLATQMPLLYMKPALTLGIANQNLKIFKWHATGEQNCIDCLKFVKRAERNIVTN